VAGLVLAGTRTRHTSYRTDPWKAAEWAIVTTSVAAVVGVLAGAYIDPASVAVATAPLAWPQLPPLPTAAILVALAPGILTPMPPLRAAAAASRAEHSTLRPSEVRP
jgi:energy-coupling factor transport system permease protein